MPTGQGGVRDTLASTDERTPASPDFGADLFPLDPSVPAVARPLGPVSRGVKRGIDIVGATLVLASLSPLLGVIALLILLEDGGPVLYRQRRVGEDGREFDFLKFRSMVRDADARRAALCVRNEAVGPIFKMRHDPRVTRVGRWIRRTSLDEMPQMLHVLCGQMSLVGPRPHLPAEVAIYTPRQRARLSVRPGLLCLREVCGRSRLDFERWVELDLVYVRKRSLGLDLWILLRAIPAVLRGDGAY